MTEHLNAILKNLESVGIVPLIKPEISHVAALTERALRGTYHKVTGYMVPKRGAIKSVKEAKTIDVDFLQRLREEGSYLAEEARAFAEAGWSPEEESIAESCALEAGESDEERFKQELTNLLMALEYPNPRIMSILPIEGRRNNVSVITFETGDGGIDQMFVKQYDTQHDLEKRKDLVLPHFLRERGVNTAVIVGYSPEEDALPGSLGFFRFDFPVYRKLGEFDYGGIVPHLDYQGLKTAGETILRLMARMHIAARKEQDVLESKYGLEMEPIDYGLIIRQRLIQHLITTDYKACERFAKAYVAMMENLSGGKFIVHGDHTCHNLRWCGKYEDIGVIDFELAEAGALPSYDLATLVNHTLSLRERDRTGLIDAGFPEDYRGMYQQQFDELARELEVPGMTTGESETDYEMLNLGNHLLRIGDQIMAMANWGDSDARKHRAQWHLANFIVGARQTTENGFLYAQQLYEVRNSVIALLKSARNIGYLKPILPTE